MTNRFDSDFERNAFDIGGIRLVYILRRNKIKSPDDLHNYYRDNRGTFEYMRNVGKKFSDDLHELMNMYQAPPIANEALSATTETRKVFKCPHCRTLIVLLDDES